MKKLIPLILLVAGGVWFATQSQNNLFSQYLGYFSLPEPASVATTPVMNYNSKQLDRRKMTIEDLPEAGSYTIVFVSASKCAQCDAMSSVLDKLMTFRKDIALRKVAALRPVNSNAKLQEMNFMKQLQDKYKINSLPLIRIYDTNKKLLAEDNTFGENGEQFIHDWIAAETKGD